MQRVPGYWQGHGTCVGWGGRDLRVPEKVFELGVGYAYGIKEVLIDTDFRLIPYGMSHLNFFTVYFFEN